MTLSDPTIKSSLLFDTIQSSLSSMSASEKAATLKRVNAIFEIKIKGKDGKPEKSWTLDFKKEGKIYAGPASEQASIKKADVVISLEDDTFQALGDGKLNGQKAFMAGKLKVKGNIMLATKLSDVLKPAGGAKL